MNDRLLKYGVPVVVGLSCAFLFYGAFSKPGYLTDVRLLGGLIFLEVLVAVLWNYRQRFFVALIVAFLWAGTSVPLRGVWTSARWAVLAAGACVGAIIYLRDHRHRLGLFPFVAFCCVSTAIVSATVSDDPQSALLKAASLFLLFLY